MSALFRSLAAVTETVGQAMMLAGIMAMVIVIVLYTGFTLPQTYMHPWFSWIKWINPIFYAFEALVSNELHGRVLECAAFIPPYRSGGSFICEAVGSVPSQRLISGDKYIKHNYGYTHVHLWRNYGILTTFMVAFHCFYLVATEYVGVRQSKAEALVFRPGRAPSQFLQSDGEALPKTGTINSVSQDDRTMPLPKHIHTLTWRDVYYDIPVKEGTKRLLDNVNGWVKPGTLTALMGVSGAGKTTLLDVLAHRVLIGVVEGQVLINGKLLTHGFPRITGYAQQQDLHLETTTVREATRFSAILRQPQSASREEKYDYVAQVIQLLGMEDFAEAVVGSQGEGLNFEQRKLLSIGVELSAKPTLLIFLDEPTSGLDSQSSWTICGLLRRLADDGQAVLATIHEPSALLFQTLGRLLSRREAARLCTVAISERS